MTNGGAHHWGRVLGSPWAETYLQELYWLARDAAQLCDEIFEAAPDEGFSVDHELHNKIYRVLNNAARIGTLFKERNRRDRQGAGLHEFQTERVAWVTGVLDGLDIHELMRAQVRHSLEHFDEFIDETAFKSSQGKFELPTMFPIDMAFAHEDALNSLAADLGIEAHTYPLRVYLAKERSFVNCGRRVDLSRLALECLAITKRLTEVSSSIGTAAAEGKRSTSILIIGDQAYE